MLDIEEFRFGYDIEDQMMPYPLPPSALRFAPTLRVASICSRDFPNHMAPSLRFPCLKQLTLYDAAISEDALHSKLSGCPVLESFRLGSNLGVGCLRIKSSSLRSFGFTVSCYSNRGQNPINLKELIIEDAPCLERLLPVDSNDGPNLVIIRVMSAPKLKILGTLSDGITTLEVGTTVFQKMISLSLTTSMRTVKILALDSCGPNLNSVVDFLRCFPCVQKLYILSHLTKDMKNKRSYNPLDPIECLETHLNEVVLYNYWGMRPDVDFAKFIILNAKVLKKMLFGTFNNCSDKWMASQRRRLQLDNRGAKDAQFKFRRDRQYGFTRTDGDTHDLRMDDPFCLIPRF